jgi:Arc-like DNA binding dprotein
MARRPQDTAQLKVRLPETLRHLIEGAAEEHGQSINAEIVERLKHSFLRETQGMEMVADALLATLPREVIDRMSAAVMREHLWEREKRWAHKSMKEKSKIQKKGERQ